LLAKGSESANYFQKCIIPQIFHGVETKFTLAFFAVRSHNPHSLIVAAGAGLSTHTRYQQLFYNCAHMALAVFYPRRAKQEF